MKIKYLRKIYPYLNNNIKNKKWRSLSDAELLSLLKEKQVISNCYDVATRYALLSKVKGKDAVKKIIKVAKTPDGKLTCKIKFNIDDGVKIYRSVTSSKKTLGQLISSAVGKMIRNNPLQKPIFSRFGRFGFHRFQEFNNPSNAFHWYTNKQVIKIGENSLSLNLKKKKDEVVYLLNNIADNIEKSCFVVISNYKKSALNSNRRWHCLPIVSINKIKKQLEIIDKRTNKIIKLTFDDLINNFKAIVGISL